jgi:hypothetical protein
MQPWSPRRPHPKTKRASLARGPFNPGKEKNYFFLAFFFAGFLVAHFIRFILPSTTTLNGIVMLSHV